MRKSGSSHADRTSEMAFNSTHNILQAYTQVYNVTLSATQYTSNMAAVTYDCR